MQILELEASLSDGAKKKIQEGSWRFIGATVQDTTTGKIVANLKTVEKKADTGYTPPYLWRYRMKYVFHSS